ncbi:Type II secretion system protein G precursor [Pseudobythopirellula maris]|uniref:Type II secretion system protein G n=1 Tax=Pseudobythopirellula maris TaxID=2527991 RepID=A0A5C5ZN13_9BACT|nr:DUF1559 domain-containing protein [Pseudobythopirellula maris]TWT88367.1 Type II secretion system protein G precursor [Pseudobythopirellula maris]
MTSRSNRRPQSRDATGFTLVELLVVIAIIGILVALLLPAVQSAREAARRLQCKNNLKNVGLSCLNYESTNSAFPTGGEVYGAYIEDYEVDGNILGHGKIGLGWGYQILPFLEEGAVHDVTTGDQMRDLVIPLYICPSRRGVTRNPQTGVVLTDYASTHPCTRTDSTEDSDQFDVTTVDQNTGWTAIHPYFITGTDALKGYSRTRPTADGGSHTVAEPDNSVKPDGVYDGVIVRSNFAILTKSRFGLRTERVNAPDPVRFAQITDGTSKTALIAEKYIRSDWYRGEDSSSDDNGWTDGWDPDVARCTCIPALPDGQLYGDLTGEFGVQPPFWVFNLGSAHTGGFNAVFADGSVHTINYEIDLHVLNALGTRNGTAAGPNGIESPETTDQSGIN